MNLRHRPLSPLTRTAAPSWLDHGLALAAAALGGFAFGCVLCAWLLRP